MSRYSFALEIKVYDHLRKRNVDRKKFRFYTLEDGLSVIKMFQNHILTDFMTDYSSGFRWNKFYQSVLLAVKKH